MASTTSNLTHNENEKIIRCPQCKRQRVVAKYYLNPHRICPRCQEEAAPGRLAREAASATPTKKEAADARRLAKEAAARAYLTRGEYIKAMRQERRRAQQRALPETRAVQQLIRAQEDLETAQTSKHRKQQALRETGARRKRLDTGALRAQEAQRKDACKEAAAVCRSCRDEVIRAEAALSPTGAPTAFDPYILAWLRYQQAMDTIAYAKDTATGKNPDLDKSYTALKRAEATHAQMVHRAQLIEAAVAAHKEYKYQHNLTTRQIAQHRAVLTSPSGGTTLTYHAIARRYAFLKYQLGYAWRGQQEALRLGFKPEPLHDFYEMGAMLRQEVEAYMPQDDEQGSATTAAATAKT